MPLKFGVGRRFLLVGGLGSALVLFGLPLVQLLWVGRPGVDPAILGAAPRSLLIPPLPETGLPLDLIQWLILAGGLALGFALGTWPLVLLIEKVPQIEQTRPWLRSHLLAAVGLVSLLTYGLNFLLPFPLSRYYNLTLVCMGRIADRDAGMALAATAAVLALFLLYALACWLCRKGMGRGLWTVVLGGAVLLSLVNLAMVTGNSTDIYDNIARGRITGIHQGNPYVHTPADYAFEPFLDYASWDNATSAYGPLWETVSALLSRLAGDALWSNILAQKLLALACYLLSTALIAAILHRIAPARAPAGTLIFAWNPLVLLDGVANAHNDLLMVTLFLGAWWFLSYARPINVAASGEPRPDRVSEGLALLLLMAAVLVKFIPALLFPFFLLYLLRPIQAGETWPRRLGRSLLLLLPAALLVIEYYAIFWEWPAITTTFTRRAEMFRMSVPSAAVNILRPHLGEEAAMATVREPFLWAFTLGYLVLVGRTALALWPGPVAVPIWDRLGRRLFGSLPQGRPIDVVLRASLIALLLYLLLLSFWFWPWYLIWPLALLALLGDERLLIPLILAGCAGELGHLAWNFLWYWWGITWEVTYQIDALVIAGLTIPSLLAYMILGWKRPPTTA